MTAEPNDLTDGWPDDPGNADLARFGADLRASLPALPDEALARVEQKLARERKAIRRRRAVLVGVGIAAALLLSAAVGWRLWSTSAPAPTPEPPRTAKEDAPAERVDDRMTVQFAPAQVETPERPLVPVERYQSLFAN